MNVEELLIQNKIKYKKSGSNFIIRCLNPEHPDIHPSMSINYVSGMGKCFSCGFKTDIFSYFGVVKNPQSTKILILKDKISKLYKKRELSFPSGFNLLDREYRNIPKEILKKYSAFTCQQEMWDGRVWFPLYDSENNLELFVGRNISSEVKPKYLFYPSNIVPPFFPNEITPRNSELILVEGIFDALNLIRFGITNVICLFGLGKVSYDNRLDLYKIKYGITTLVLMLDSDYAGTSAMNKLENIYKHSFNIKRIELPSGKDPGALVESDIETLRKQLKYE